MKKQLKSQIKSLAQDILSNDGSKSTSQMKVTARLLYEKLAVLEYLEVQILGEEKGTTHTKPEDSLDSKSYRESNWFKDPKPVPQRVEQEAVVEPVIEKIKDLVAQMPEESKAVDDLLDEVLPKKNYTKNDLEEFASHYQETPVFERKEEVNSVVKAEPAIEEKIDAPMVTEEAIKNSEIDRPKSLNDKLNSGLNIGLNDRLAFIKHLFDGSAEDYTRVLSQINTFSTYSDSESFIKLTVKPDYNDWMDKEDVANRFMKIVENSFN
jgi:hypothetical protein